VTAFIDAAKGRAKTLTFVETENGGSICGGYLDVAWADGFTKDPGRRSFIFTLKNNLGVPPTKFAQKRGDEVVSYMGLGHSFCFGCGEGFDVVPRGSVLKNDHKYEAPDEGATLFTGDSGGEFLAARWELWEVVRFEFDLGLLRKMLRSRSRVVVNGADKSPAMRSMSASFADALTTAPNHASALINLLALAQWRTQRDALPCAPCVGEPMNGWSFANARSSAREF
jgi:hypothetical protein